jgi:hypothetical protein
MAALGTDLVTHLVGLWKGITAGSGGTGFMAGAVGLGVGCRWISCLE